MATQTDTQGNQESLATDADHSSQIKKGGTVTTDPDQSSIESQFKKFGPFTTDPEHSFAVANNLIEEVFLRSPVKSLLRFKCIDKYWFNVISSPNFIEAHLSLSMKNEDSYSIIVSHFHSHSRLQTCSLPSIWKESPCEYNPLAYPLEQRWSIVQVVGSHHGLVCLVVDGMLCLWNPSRRKYKTVYYTRNSKCKYIVYGFGWVEDLNNYKIVVIQCFQLALVKVFSLRTNSWTIIEGFPHGLPAFQDAGKCVGGCLHWVTKDAASNFIIVSLDLSTETYKELEQPNYCEKVHVIALSILDGCLSVLSDIQGRQADLWVLKKYGSPQSWIRMLSIPYVKPQGYDLYTRPLWISKEKCKLLLLFRSQLVLFDFKNNTFTYPGINKKKTCTQAELFISSLVLPGNGWDEVHG